MSTMKRDVNFGLFVLIIATLFVFAGFTSYYQSTFENLSSEYTGKLGELSKVTTNLQMEKNRLNQTSFQLKVKEETAEDLKLKYDTMRGLKDQLESDKATLQAELSSTKNQLATSKVQLAQKTDELGQKKTELEAARTRIEQLKSDLSNCEESSE